MRVNMIIGAPVYILARHVNILARHDIIIIGAPRHHNILARPVIMIDVRASIYRHARPNNYIDVRAYLYRRARQYIDVRATI